MSIIIASVILLIAGCVYLMVVAVELLMFGIAAVVGMLIEVVKTINRKAKQWRSERTSSAQ